MLNSALIVLRLRAFNSFGDGLVTKFGTIRFKGYRCVNGTYRKVFSVAGSKVIANCGGYGLKGIFRRALKVG